MMAVSWDALLVESRCADRASFSCGRFSRGSMAPKVASRRVVSLSRCLVVLSRRRLVIRRSWIRHGTENGRSSQAWAVCETVCILSSSPRVRQSWATISSFTVHHTRIEAKGNYSLLFFFTEITKVH